ALTSAAAASAQEYVYENPPPTRERVEYERHHRAMVNTGAEIGMRVAYAGAVGKVYSGLNFVDSNSGSIPITVDIGYRIFPWLYIGVLGTWGKVITAANPVSCPQGSDCSAHVWRIGAEADFHFIPHSHFDPYLGVGFGYEILQSNVETITRVPTPVGTIPAHAS